VHTNFHFNLRNDIRIITAFSSTGGSHGLTPFRCGQVSVGFQRSQSFTAGHAQQVSGSIALVMIPLDPLKDLPVIKTCPHPLVLGHGDHDQCVRARIQEINGIAKEMIGSLDHTNIAFNPILSAHSR